MLLKKGGKKSMTTEQKENKAVKLILKRREDKCYLKAARLQKK